jgi:hypothetical protein
VLAVFAGLLFATGVKCIVNTVLLRRMFTEADARQQLAGYDATIPNSVATNPGPERVPRPVFDISALESCEVPEEEKCNACTIWYISYASLRSSAASVVISNRSPADTPLVTVFLLNLMYIRYV